MRLCGRFVPALHRHAVLIPAAGLTGAVVVVVADAVIRAVLGADEAISIPTGITTTLVGAVLMIVLARRSRDAGPARQPPAARVGVGSRHRFVGVLVVVTVAALAVVVLGLLGGDTWLRTGDVGTIDANGFIRIVDRLKDMIAVGGFKVFPSQIEAVLYRHPAVKEALVIGLPDSYRGEIPRAYVTLVDGATATGEELAAWLNPQLGKHERVDQVVVRLTLPKTMVGKLSRKDLIAEVMSEV